MRARMASSLGPEKKLYCKKCLIEQEVFPGAGHPINCVDLHCVVCGSFVTRLKKNKKGGYELDTSVYGKSELISTGKVKKEKNKK